LFQPFTQVSEGYTRQHQGAGLGLSISKKLVSLMGGNISIDSEVGRGTTVHFCATFKLNQYCPLESAVQDKIERTPSMMLSVLLVEDEQVNRLSARRLLEKAGCSVTTAEDGLQAINSLRTGSFDVVLMDIQMPVMSGVDATKAIRGGEVGKFKANIPIIAMTAYTMSGDKDNFLDAGMDGHIAKPFDMSGLKEIIYKVMAIKGAR